MSDGINLYTNMYVTGISGLILNGISEYYDSIRFYATKYPELHNMHLPLANLIYWDGYDYTNFLKYDAVSKVYIPIAERALIDCIRSDILNEHDLLYSLYCYYTDSNYNENLLKHVANFYSYNWNSLKALIARSISYMDSYYDE